MFNLVMVIKRLRCGGSRRKEYPVLKNPAVIVCILLDNYFCGERDGVTLC